MNVHNFKIATTVKIEVGVECQNAFRLWVIELCRDDVGLAQLTYKHKRGRGV